MLLPRFVVGMFSIGVELLGADVVSGQDFPNKPIRIVTSPVGGGVDLAARLIAQGLTGLLGQQVIVDNRSGGGAIPAELVSKAPPDGYTLLVASGILWIQPFLQDVPYDPVRDFSPVSLMNQAPTILVVHPSVAANSVKELIALAKAKPGMLNYASSGTGSSGHLAGELFKAMAGANIVRVNYRGGGPAVSSLVSGEVQLMFATPASVAPHVKSGRLRALAVTSAQPSALLPGLPTVAASGVPGYESVVVFGILAPARTPKAIIHRLYQEIVRGLNLPDVKEKFFNAGVEVVASSPEEFAATIKSDMVTMGKVIKDAGSAR